MNQPTVQPNPPNEDPFRDRVTLPEPEISPPQPGTAPAAPITVPDTNDTDTTNELDPMDKTLADSFPASDPPSYPQTIGGPANEDANPGAEQTARA